MSIQRRRADIAAVAFLCLLPLLWFWPVIFGGRTLLPVDNLFAWEPWRSYAAAQGVSVPHNALLSDLILQNYSWKLLIREALAAGQLPLWNPYILTGTPFLAAGQHSALYPFSLIYYVAPLWQAYGLFTWSQLALAGGAMYGFARVLRLRPLPSLVAAVAFAYSLFFIVSVVFPMIIASAAWLPLLLAAIEMIIRKQEEKGGAAYSPVPHVVLGSATVGMNALAGHVEITYYTLLVGGLYALCRLLMCGWRLRRWQAPLRLGAWLLVMVALGLGAGAVQLLPLAELAQGNFREGSVTLAQVRGWAFPSRQVLSFVIPDFFGNPTHHGYWDIFTRQWLPATHNALGEPTDTLFWGIKNYVEAGSYVGLLPLLLAAVAVARARRSPHRRFVALFGGLALLALAFIFGTPLYAILFYGLPGFSQLHSPFRWVLPYTLAVAVLAGIGLDGVLAHWDGRRRALPAWLGGAAVALGVGVLVLVTVSVGVPAPFIGLGERVLAASEQARAAFADGRAFWSYQAVNLLKFGGVLALSGSALVWTARRPRRGGLALLAVLVLDLWLYGHGFNPATSPALLTFRPPVVDFLAQDTEPWRFTTLIAPGEKTLNANAGMHYGWQDVRGYDSIIGRDYAEYMAQIEPQGELLYNRIAPLTDVAALDSPLLHLLGVRYIVTTQTIAHPDFARVYDAEVKVYRNGAAFPRAFVVHRAVAVSRADALATLAAVNPAETVVLTTPATAGEYVADAASHAAIRDYGLNQVTISATLAVPGWLVLTDAYYPGWRAYVRPADTPDATESPLTVTQADGNFRAVFLPAGEHVVRFRYSPDSFRYGLYISFIAVLSLLVLLAGWLWGRFYREDTEAGAVQRVAKNSLIPMGASLLNKGIDFAFALLRLRILLPVGEGSYTTAIVFIGYFEILVRFGLGTLLTREVAHDRAQAGRYFSNTVMLRTLLWLVSLPLMLGTGWLYSRFSGLTPDEMLAIGLFAVGLLFGNVADSVSATFNAYEKMEYPAGVSVVIALSKVTLGAAVLVAGWGFVGLAAVSVVTNVLQAAWLWLLMRRRLLVPVVAPDTAFQRQMLAVSFPLMINHFLATAFFRLDVLVLRAFKGEAVVGMYGAAYKYIDGLNVIPSYFTLAIFPLMSRLARSQRDSLLRAYVLSLRVLLMFSLPVAVATTFLARPLILVLGGSEYLPAGQIALQLLIWSIPIGFINSVTQFLLIALDQQRFLTRAFILGMTFNLVTNLALIPRYSYPAAAVTTVLSEFALLLPFYYAVRKHLAPVPWAQIVWQPALAATLMAAAMAALQPVSPGLALLAGGTVYLLALVVTGAFRDPDLALVLGKLSPFRASRKAAVGSGE